jgi:hypothetical protein
VWLVGPAGVAGRVVVTALTVVAGLLLVEGGTAARG